MEDKAEFSHVDIALIDDPERSMRTNIDEENLRDLADSIRANGIIEPLVLRRKGERFEVIAGHRRLAAAWLARLGQVPAMVRDADDRQTTILRVHENLIREDVDSVSEAIFIARSLQELEITPEEYAKMIGRGDQYVYDRLAIAEMPEFLQDALRVKSVPLGVALALQDLPDDNLKQSWLFSAAEGGITVRGMRDAVRDHLNLLSRIKESGEDAPPPEQFSSPPIVLYPCARCGQNAPLEDLKIVRIHLKECPSDIQG